MKKHLGKIFLIIILILGFVVRLYRIETPLADWHSWRQADTAAVTRNFFKYGIDVLKPRYDDFSDVSGEGLFNPQGYRMVEFPIFNLIHYSLAKTFPFQSLVFWGRMTSILSALASSILLYFLIKRHVNQTAGLLAAAFYLFIPYNIYFTRVILPEPLMVTLVLLTLNLFDLYLKRSNWLSLILTALAGTAAMLVKPMALFFFLPMLWQVRSRLKEKSLYVLGALILLPYLAWRVWMGQFPQGTPAYWWLLNGNGIRFRPAFFRWIFGERIGDMILGHWGLWPALVGVIYGNSYVVLMILSSLIYLFIIATGNVQHDYYQIPIIPSIAAALAAGVAYLWHQEASFLRTWTKRILVVFSIGLMIGLSWYDIKDNYQINNWSIVHAGQAVDKLVPQDAVIVAPYNGDTAFLYQTNRRGFAFLPLPIKDLHDAYGVMYYVSVNYDDQTNAIMKKYTILEQTPEYVIVELLEPWEKLQQK